MMFLIIICFVHKTVTVLHICIGKRTLLEDGQKQEVERSCEQCGQAERQSRKQVRTVKHSYFEIISNWKFPSGVKETNSF